MTDAVQPSEHISDRPAWKCRACDQPWPCAHARDELCAEFREFPSVLRIYMSGQMLDAARDFAAGGHELPTDLYQRFLAWTRSMPEMAMTDKGRPDLGWPDVHTKQEPGRPPPSP